MLPQVMHVSSQPGHLTGSEGSEHSPQYPVFAPIMYMPQMQDQTFLFQNQQLAHAQNQMSQNTMVMAPQMVPSQLPVEVTPTTASTPAEEGGEGNIIEEASEQQQQPQAETAPTLSSASTTPMFLPMTNTGTEFPTMHLPSTVAPAQFVNPMVFPQVPMGQMGQHQMPQFVPCVVPNGAFPPTAFQPMYFVQQPNPAAPVFNQPEQHPISMRSDSSHSRHEHSKSFDGSEFSDLKSNSLRRFSSDHSKDGYGSDFWDNRSRMGSEQDEDKQEDRPVQSQRYYKNNHYVDHHNSNKRQYNNNRGRERSRSGSQKRPTSKERQEEMYKTELCSAWVNQKKCRFGHRCIFAHGTHELRTAKRKQERQKMRPPLKKFMTGLLNKLCKQNFEQVMTEFMTVCLEEISEHNMNDEGKSILKSFFNKAVADEGLREELVNSVSKMLRSHTHADSLKILLSEACFNEYSKPRNKDFALSTVDLIGLLVCRRIISQKIVHQILEETQMDTVKQIKVELWLRLIENLKDKADTGKYFPALAKFKSMSTRIRFAIMDLEDLRRNNWNNRM